MTFRRFAIATAMSLVSFLQPISISSMTLFSSAVVLLSSQSKALANSVDYYLTKIQSLYDQDRDKGREKDIINYANKALDLDPRNGDALFFRAVAKVDIGDLKGGISDYNKVLKVMRNDEWAYQNRGYAKYLLKDYSGALSDYNKTLKINPNNEQAVVNRAILYEALGKAEKSCADWRKASKLKVAGAKKLFIKKCL